ncbi:hypothetical protein DYB32_000692, partial [Aphanomyces invadans]
SLLLYKIGMQVSIVVDVLWYALGWNGSPTSTVGADEEENLSKETAYWIHLVLSVVVFACNITGLLYGWKLRRVVNSVVNQRECERAALVAEPKPPPKRSVSLGGANPKFTANTIRTSKYTLWNFVFVFFKMQFSRLANVYTCIVVTLCFFSFSPVGPEASLIPLLIVFTTAAIKDVSEDLRRHKSDFKVNSKPVRILRQNDTIDDGIVRSWKDVVVGDLLVLKEGDEVPADCLVLATDNKSGMCYVQTANLDGETNMKIRQALTTNRFASPKQLQSLNVTVSCDAPNKNMFEWSGYVDINSEYLPASIDNLLLRGCDLVNSEWTVALVLYTGPETKIALNASDGVKKNKRSLVERSLDNMFVIVLVVLFTISLYCSLGNRRWSTTNSTLASIYPDYLDGVAVVTKESKKSDYIFLSYVILFNNLIPLSMYVTMEGIRFVHARYIESDLAMYDPVSDMPAEARNSNINEDLGQIQYIFSDKTGTLTRNEMVFAKCTVAGLKYNDLDLDKVSAQRRRVRLITFVHGSAHNIHEFLTLLMVCNTAMPQMENGEVRYQAASPDEQALCLAAHDLTYCLKSRSGSKCEVSIQGVPAEFDILHVIEFNSDRKRMSVICRTPSGRINIYCKGADDVIFDRLDPGQPQGVLHVTKGHLQDYASQGLRTLTTAMREIPLEEYTAWKVIYDDAEASMDKGKLAAAAELVECGFRLLGATAIEDLLQEGVGECITSLRKAGINFWVLTGDKKETAISVGMSSEVIDDSMDVIVLDSKNKDQLTETLEELYSHMVEDKWGTKKDDAISVVIFQTLKRVCVMGMNYFLSMLSGKYRILPKKRHRKRRPNSDANNINMDVFPHHEANVNSISSVSTAVDPFSKDFEPVSVPIHNNTSTEDTIEDDTIEYAMVIDGKTLALVLDNDIKYLFLAVAQQCKSVVCCRCSPSQKAAVVRLVTEPTLLWTPGNVSLAIGDGANDVPMIQAASVGVGISGKEGRQAVLSSDYAFAQFRFLKRLVLVHGNYSYKRVSKLLLFSFMKNIALSFTGFFMAPQTLYSGLLMYFSILFTLYNALFSTIPIVVLAMYNQDVSPAALMQYPTLYHNGLDNRSFNMSSFLGWCSLGIWHAYAVSSVPFTCDGYFFNWFTDDETDVAVFHGQPLGLWADGVASYTYLIVSSTFQISLLTSNWTMPNVVGVYGTLVFYFVFMWFFSSAYSIFDVDVLEIYEAANVFQQLSGEAWFWLGMVMTGVVAVLPNFILRAGRVLFYPEPSHLMREWNKMPTDEAYRDETMHVSPRMIRNQTGFAFSEGAPIEAQTIVRATSK